MWFSSALLSQYWHYFWVLVVGRLESPIIFLLQAKVEKLENYQILHMFSLFI